MKFNGNYILRVSETLKRANHLQASKLGRIRSITFRSEFFLYPFRTRKIELFDVRNFLFQDFSKAPKTVDFDARGINFLLRKINSLVRRIDCSVQRIDCSVRRIDCSVRRIDCSVQRIDCSVRRIDCSVQRIDCSVRRIDCSVQRIDCLECAIGGAWLRKAC
jgi:hypothetical protein